MLPTNGTSSCCRAGPVGMSAAARRKRAGQQPLTLRSRRPDQCLRIDLADPAEPVPEALPAPMAGAESASTTAATARLARSAATMTWPAAAAQRWVEWTRRRGNRCFCSRGQPRRSRDPPATTRRRGRAWCPGGEQQALSALPKSAPRAPVVRRAGRARLEQLCNWRTEREWSSGRHRRRAGTVASPPRATDRSPIRAARRDARRAGRGLAQDAAAR
jgi:hypothetical protein